MKHAQKIVPSFVTRSRSSRVLVPLLVAVFGVTITLVVWWTSIADERRRQRDHFVEVVEENHEILADRLERKITALRRLAGYWHLYGLKDEAEWQYEAHSLMTHFPGIAWIAWVPSAGSRGRVAASDSTFLPTAGQIAAARERFGRPESELAGPGSSDAPLQFFSVARPLGDSLGVMTAAIVVDWMLRHGELGSRGFLAYTVRAADGREVLRSGTPAADVPQDFHVERKLPSTLGGDWVVRYEPTPGYLNSSNPAWPDYFLLTGLMLSLALSVLAIQFVRLRDTSLALEASNRRLDRQVRELSERDRELRELNESLEAKIQASTTDLREALHELETFSHSVSHDLRSPIGAVLNFAAVLVEDHGHRLDANGMQMLRRILASGESATRLLDQLGDFVSVSRADEPHVRIDMTGLARDAYHEAVAAERSGGAPIELDLKTLPEARGEPDLVARVFRNLIRNALKYARPRPVRQIEIGAMPGQRDNTYFVADNGIGFDPQLKETIFEPFRRPNQAREFEGSGLGLAIVDKIIRKHGGKAWAESDGENGARFFFTLPTEEAGA